MVLLAVMQAGQRGLAYGVSIHEEMTERARRRVARGAVYMTLDRLERKGLVTSTLSDPTPERGGRAKRAYRVSRAGLAALRASHRALTRLWEGLSFES